MDNKYVVDEHAEPMLLSSVGQQVMMAWEREYMEQCVDALCISNSCDVLEIGFGLGYSATHIMKYRPRTYTIIECDPVVLERIHLWASDYDNVFIVAGTWQTQLCSLAKFDCVFFDDYPLPQNERDFSCFTISRWYEFLDSVLNWHTKLGGRVTGYLARELDFTRPGCSVTLRPIEVQVPLNCNYFPYKQALVPLVTLNELVDRQITTYTLPTNGPRGVRAVNHPKLLDLREKLDKQIHQETLKQIHQETLEKDEEKITQQTESRREFIERLRAAKQRKLN
ncbi:hypothetical protein THRCLA_08710 [Thraustotheca clavata]|uniref:Uncharacterized protein n=1 Tax=Thraustotheca clavata TaxID=74557 RepID=A0A1V9Z341_9STRA|nr:hypothetical protein THRCLA_08710 [Thraustotheca clavata]